MAKSKKQTEKKIKESKKENSVTEISDSSEISEN